MHKSIRKLALIILAIGLVYAGVFAYYYSNFRSALSSYQKTASFGRKVGVDYDSKKYSYSLSIGGLNKTTKQIKTEEDKLEEKLSAHRDRLVVEVMDGQEELIDLQTSLANITDKASNKLETDSKAELQKESVGNLYDKTQELQKDAEATRKEIQKIAEDMSAKDEFSNPLWSKTNRELEQLIKKMSARQKAAQLLMFAAEGQMVGDSYSNQLKTQQPGGLILMGSNISDEDQVKELTKDLQKTNTAIPLLIATDQEGGAVKRVGWDTTSGASAWKNLDQKQICELSTQRAKTLHQAGINTNFAPVVDLSSNGKDAFINNRTISPDPKVVTKLGEEFVRCSQNQHVFTTLKHYPGHGATKEDSHFTMPAINKSKNDWLKTDAIPFDEIEDAKLIMIGHLQFSTIDQKPASQSKVLVSDILRKQFDYQGVIITDDMGQLHTSTKIDSKTAMLNAYNSGIDIVLYVNPPKSKQDIINELEQLITNKQIPQEQIDKALMRILKLKREIV